MFPENLKQLLGLAVARRSTATRVPWNPHQHGLVRVTEPIKLLSALQGQSGCDSRSIDRPNGNLTLRADRSTSPFLSNPSTTGYHLGLKNCGMCPRGECYLKLSPYGSPTPLPLSVCVNFHNPVTSRDLPEHRC